MKKPNVIMIVADDMGYGDFGVFSEGGAKTPILDNLVSEGVCLTEHYAASPVCAPARAGMLTGRYPNRTGVIDTLEMNGLDRMNLCERTIGDAFKDAGYKTALIGKWHCGSIGEKYHPNQRGFEEFIGFRGGWMYFNDWKIERNGVFEKSDGTYITDLFTDESVNYIKKNKDNPFFLHLAYNAPHFPFEAPEEDIKVFRDMGKFNEKVCTLYAMLAVMDRGIGRVMDTLKECGIDENTIVMFTSDNGPQLYGDVDRYNCNLRSEKKFVYEGGIKVPAILRWPGRIEGGTRNHDLMTHCDWMPTFMSMCGIEIPDELRLDGRDFTDILLNDAKAEFEPKHFWQWNRYKPMLECNAAHREGNYKLIHPPIDAAMSVTKEDIDMDIYAKDHIGEITEIIPFGQQSDTIVIPQGRAVELAGKAQDDKKPIVKKTGDFSDITDIPKAQLFDLANDPGEQNDLYDEMPELASRLTAELKEWFDEVESERLRGSDIEKEV